MTAPIAVLDKHACVSCSIINQLVYALLSFTETYRKVYGDLKVMLGLHLMKMHLMKTNKKTRERERERKITGIWTMM